MSQRFIAAFIFVMTLCSLAAAADFKNERVDPNYNHDKWGTSSNGYARQFRAYISSFDTQDDDNGDGAADVLGVPEWVAYEIKRTSASCIRTYARPTQWITDRQLNDIGIMPEDSSYAYPSDFRSNHPDWFSRGHLAMKMLAERLGAAAGWNTHTFYNAVPQRQLFNAGIWLDLEDLTGAWAQKYGSVWVITGPIFADRSPIAYLGENGELPVAIPDALFKIVIKDGPQPNSPDVMAFIYPQVGPGYYMGKPYDHTRYMTSIDEIEKLTGIDFLTTLSVSDQERIESYANRILWPSRSDDFVRACRGGSD